MLMLSRVFCLLFSAYAGTCWAVSFSNGINESRWQASGSVFECRLQQPVPLFGDVIFRTRAGESSGFYLRAKVARFEAGPAQLVARSPVWSHPTEQVALGDVPVKRGTRPLWLGRDMTELMLAKLNLGMEVALVRESWYDTAAEPIDLAISSIGFRSEYRKYLDCLAGLLPANFDQLKRSTVHFSAGLNERLSGTATRRLDQILQLTKHDQTIRMFYIDGHADAAGTRVENLELSKVRAELVRDYLLNNGISDAQMVVRWHGERYPVASNQSEAGRSQNRRVTIRLERTDPGKQQRTGVGESSMAAKE